MEYNIIDRFTEKWGDRFDYSDVEYKGYKVKVHIRCKEHDEWFWQTPEMHLKFNGCKECSKKARSVARSLGKDEFVKRCKELYGDQYDYSRVNYINNNSEVEIICKKHGVFKVVPSKLMTKESYCPQCKKEQYVNPRALIYSQILERFHSIHGDKYEYDETTFTKYTEKMRMICPIHGEFWKSPYKHICGQGCPKCSIEKQGTNLSYTTNDFINISKKIHGDKYDYSKTVYTKSSADVTIICHEKDENGIEHGEFIQNAASHMHGCGCPKCAALTRANRYRKANEQFIEEAKRVHKDDNYDYSHVVYKNRDTAVKIICPIHGEFLQKPSKHLLGHGCPKCAKNGVKLTQYDFIAKANEIHDGKYDYSKTRYTVSREKVIITCPIHGDFEQEAESHLNGVGCPKCASIMSKSEIELSDYVKSIVGENFVDTHNRTILNGKEIDIFVKPNRIAIEYDGLFWHSEDKGKDRNYHLAKTEDAALNGIKMIHVFEDEWVNKKEIVKAKLAHILHATNAKTKIMARKCSIKEIGSPMANNFLDENHIQGKSSASVRLGAFYNDELVGVMTFKLDGLEKDKNWELNRFATKLNYISQGVCGKMFSYFVRNYSPNSVKSFADRRWTIDVNENLYTKIGFKLDEALAPDYKYYDNRHNLIKRIHKFNFRKQILHKKYGFPLTMTESEMTKELGLYRVWDCGLFKYIWKKE